MVENNKKISAQFPIHTKLILLKSRRRRKAKVAKGTKLILRTSVITTKNWVIGSETVERK